MRWLMYSVVETSLPLASVPGGATGSFEYSLSCRSSREKAAALAWADRSFADIVKQFRCACDARLHAELHDRFYR